MSEQGFATKAVHAGEAPDPVTGSRATAIHQTTSYQFQDAGHAARLFGLQEFGNIYTRIQNPTQGALEGKLAALEGGTAALAVASGHAAQALVAHTLLEPGDEILAAKQLYGGSINQFSQAFKKFGWGVKFVDGTKPENFKAAITEKTRFIFTESIANPGGIVMDLEAIAKIATDAKIPYVVDNTLATPYLIRPIEWGANIVVHSLTKFIGGHGNSIGGAIVDGGNFDWKASGKFPSLTEPSGSYHGLVLNDVFAPMGISFAIAARVLGLRDLGAAIAPFNSFLILTGAETLHLRMQRHSDSALAVAEWLKTHEKVSWVSYAGLADDPFNPLLKKYSPKGGGAVLTFGVKGGYDAGVKLVNGVKLFSHLANLGDVRSLVIHPASTTHSQLSDEGKIAAGAGPDVVRLSVGLEDVADLTADLDQALNG
ncbi:O-acetyl-L-homoserine sulfhydrylase [Alphaproteobacteria bacterium SO-S41]|nr:O-acetyl-L-homoserine sulfhydrylase [Alphaproteobacteria bacterium SO-S41]